MVAAQEDLRRLIAQLKTAPATVSTLTAYKPCLEITDPDMAREHFLVCVAYSQKRLGRSFEDMINLEKVKFGYYSGFAESLEIRQRVEKLYHCVHPFAGPAAVSEGRHLCNIQLSTDFPALCRAWDTQPRHSRSFGMFVQPSAT